MGQQTDAIPLHSFSCLSRPTSSSTPKARRPTKIQVSLAWMFSKRNWKKRQNNISFPLLPKLPWRHTQLSSYIFSKEREIAEARFGSYLLDGLIGRT